MPSPSRGRHVVVPGASGTLGEPRAKRQHGRRPGKSPRALAWLALALVALLTCFAAWRVSTQRADVDPVCRLALGLPDADPSALEPAAASVPAEESRAPVHAAGRIATAADEPAAPRATPGARLSGVVRPPLGQERLTNPASLIVTDGAGSTRRATTDAAGEFSLGYLRAGPHWIRATSDHDGTAELATELPAAGEQRVELHLARDLEVAVEVVDPDGRPGPFGHLAAVATVRAPGAWLGRDGPCARGPTAIGVWRARAPGSHLRQPAAVELGTLRLPLAPPLHVSLVDSQRVVATQPLPPGVTRVRFVLDPGSPLLQPTLVRFRVVDPATGAPLPRARFNLSTAASPAGGGPSYLSATDARGEFRGPARPGLAFLQLLSASAPYARHVQVEPGVLNDLGDLELANLRSIAGTVVDERGRGIRGEVRLHPWDPSGAGAFERGPSPDWVSDPRGVLEIDGLQPGTYLLTAWRREAPESRRAQVVDVRAGSVRGLRIELARGATLVLRPTERAWQLVEFEVFDSAGLPCGSGRLHGPGPRQVELAPGDHHVEIRVDGEVRGERRLVRLGSEPVAIAIP